MVVSFPLTALQVFTVGVFCFQNRDGNRTGEGEGEGDARSGVHGKAEAGHGTEASRCEEEFVSQLALMMFFCISVIAVSGIIYQELFLKSRLYKPEFNSCLVEIVCLNPKC